MLSAITAKDQIDLLEEFLRLHPAQTPRITSMLADLRDVENEMGGDRLVWAKYIGATVEEDAYFL